MQGPDKSRYVASCACEYCLCGCPAWAQRPRGSCRTKCWDAPRRKHASKSVFFFPAHRMIPVTQPFASVPSREQTCAGLVQRAGELVPGRVLFLGDYSWFYGAQLANARLGQGGTMPGTAGGGLPGLSLSEKGAKTPSKRTERGME